jgi:hypothetical protein
MPFLNEVNLFAGPTLSDLHVIVSRSQRLIALRNCEVRTMLLHLLTFSKHCPILAQIHVARQGEYWRG